MYYMYRSCQISLNLDSVAIEIVLNITNQD